MMKVTKISGKSELDFHIALEKQMKNQRFIKLIQKPLALKLCLHRFSRRYADKARGANSKR
jgi:hypothetical protein